NHVVDQTVEDRVRDDDADLEDRPEGHHHHQDGQMLGAWASAQPVVQCRAEIRAVAQAHHGERGDRCRPQQKRDAPAPTAAVAITPVADDGAKEEDDRLWNGQQEDPGGEVGCLMLLQHQLSSRRG
ncbi:MAG: hypothetical protein ACK56I_24585, partial [bacterium]